MKQSAFHEALAQATVDLSLPPDALQLMEQHWELVRAWNARVNLTAIADPVDAAWLHYRDSLEALPLLPAGPVVDVGSGAGFPGIPIAIAQRGRSVALLEPRRKRVSFLQVAVARLALSNVRVREGAVEDSPDQEYAAAVTRATFSAAADIEGCRRWVRRDGIVVAYRTDETGQSAQVHPYTLRGTRRVLELWPRSR